MSNSTIISFVHDTVQCLDLTGVHLGDTIESTTLAGQVVRVDVHGNKDDDNVDPTLAFILAGNEVASVPLFFADDEDVNDAAAKLIQALILV